MDLNLKAGVYSAAAAFVISTIAGAVGGVPFGILLLRAVIGAVVFGAGGIGVDILISYVLPELKAELGVPDEVGGNVDIVVSDDDEEADNSAVYSSDEAEYEEDEEGDPLVQEVEELSLDDVPGAGPAAETDPDLLDDTIDYLPEIGGFADSFRSGGDDSSEFGDGSASAASGGLGSDTGGDARVMAKALQTIMKRDG